jgi:prophage regulatory protein
MEKLLRIADVCAAVGFKANWIYVLIRSGKFPPPVKTGKRASRWRASEVQAWIETQIAGRGEISGA